MSIRRSRAGLILALAGGIALAASGCGRGNDAERLQRATEALAAAKQEVAQARDELAARQTRAAEANQAVEEARERLERAEEKERAAASSEDLRVSDATIFRTVQERLLQDGKLEKVAIQARVTQGTVVLSGKVPSEKQRDRAIELTRETPGVVDVQSQIEVMEKPGS